MKKILSIVVPTYNMEQYLNRCINSFIEASEVLPELEIIIVNDGSTDKSLDIALKYKELYPTSVVVIDKKNGNYGSCINAGLKIATGKYFKIVDADDKVNTSELIKFIKKIRDIDSDLIVTNFEVIHKNNRKEIRRTSQPIFEQIIPIESPLLMKYVRKDFTMHKSTFRTELLREIGYMQTEGISYTDTEFVYYPLLHTKNIIFLNLNLYQYFVGREGQTISIKSRINHANDIYIIIKRLLKTPIINKEKQSLYHLQMEFLCFIISGYYHIKLVLQPLDNQTNLQLKVLDKQIQSFSQEVYDRMNLIKCLKLPYIKIWRKYNIQIINPNLYSFLKKIK